MAESPTKGALAERDREYSTSLAGSSSPKRERTTSYGLDADFSPNRDRTHSGHLRDRTYSATEHSDHTFLGHSHGVQNNDLSIIQGFTEKTQELTIIARKRTSSIHIDPRDLENYAFELQDLHLKSAEEVSATIATSISTGLSAEEAVRRLEKFGPNVLQPKKDWPLVVKFLISMTHGFGPLLWAATALAFISWQPFAPDNFYNLTMGVILAIINFLSALFTFYQERKAMTVLSGFKKMVAEDCLVIRGGTTVKVDASQLTVGDIVLLQTGKRVPADMRLISTAGLKLDKSMLTGEFEPSRASSAPGEPSCSYLESTNIAFMGCNVVEGEGNGMVIAVGKDNQLAKIMQDIASQKEKPTTLQREIDRVVAFIATFAGVTSLAIVLWWRYSTSSTRAS